MIDPPHLTPAEQALLLDLARRSLAARVESRRAPSPQDLPARVRAPQGAFVTLRSRGALRGCIGVAAPVRALASTVIECAAAAATEDPRFDPLAPAELPGVRIEITTLLSPFRISGPEDIRTGIHGVMIRDGIRRGLLLPQVAIEQGWDAARLIEETCVKAGLARDAWMRNAIVEAFAAQIFGETDAGSY